MIHWVVWSFHWTKAHMTLTPRCCRTYKPCSGAGERLQKCPDVWSSVQSKCWEHISRSPWLLAALSACQYFPFDIIGLEHIVWSKTIHFRALQITLLGSSFDGMHFMFQCVLTCTLTTYFNLPIVYTITSIPSSPYLLKSEVEFSMFKKIQLYGHFCRIFQNNLNTFIIGWHKLLVQGFVLFS